VQDPTVASRGLYDGRRAAGYVMRCELLVARRQSVQNFWDNAIPIFFMAVFIVVLVYLGVTHH
jgi:hypothetical protein